MNERQKAHQVQHQMQCQAHCQTYCQPQHEVRFATTFLARLKGLAFGRHKQLALGEILCIVPCSSVHTFGMKAHLDVAFLDKLGIVRKIAKRLPPNRVVAARKAALVLERVASKEEWFEVGQKVCLLPLAAHDEDVKP